MNAGRRLAGIERRLGMGRRVGPQMVCPRCDGTGVDDTAARLEVEIPRRMNAVAAQLCADAGLPPPTSTAREYDVDRDGPLPLPVPCHLCASTGRASVAAVEAAERDAIAGGERTTALMLAVAERVRAQVIGP